VNLEYLSIALKVRRQEDREPLFSLDPVTPKEDSMQVKRFEPEWLAGTSVGEVLFQSDYYLKELSLGEYEQPVVGMRSCFDFSWDEGHDKEWRAREWFIVRKAEVHISEDNVLIPYVRMGVEAWEQVVGTDGKIDDAKVTRRDHPLLKYAQSFTHNFDLIAERKSVIFHLRELAKASVLAKYLIDSHAQVPKAWFEVGEAMDGARDCLEIPMLWNERHVSKIGVKEGTIVVNGVKGSGGAMHGVYGGVNFGLDRFRSSAPTRVSRAMLDGRPARPAAPGAMLTTTQAFVAPGRVSTAVFDGGAARAGLFARPQGFAPTAVSESSYRPRFQGFGPLARTVGVRGAPQGVDLNLDNFDLTNAKPTTTQVPRVQYGEAAGAAIGKVFWSNVDRSHGSMFKDEDHKLLVDIFNPHLCDRRSEADQFVPPDTSSTYLERLSGLMKDEEAKRLERMRHFCSKQFVASDPGPLFPSSWKDLIEIERAQGKACGLPQENELQERSDYKAEAHMFDHLLKSAIPEFDKSTEDGMRFRSYKVGSLEVRTTQKLNADEIVGVVFSMLASTQAPAQDQQSRQVKDHERISKASVYVARDQQWSEYHRYYLVLETDAGNKISTEMLWDGTVAWHENPAGLEDRNSLAKAFRSKECRGSVTVDDMKRFQGHSTRRRKVGAFHSSGKRYAQVACDRALGDARR